MSRPSARATRLVAITEDNLPSISPTRVVASKESKKKSKKHANLGTKRWAPSFYQKPITAEERIIGGNEQAWTSTNPEISDFKVKMKTAKVLLDLGNIKKEVPVYLAPPSRPLPDHFPQKIMVKLTFRLGSYFPDPWTNIINVATDSTPLSLAEQVMADIIKKTRSNPKIDSLKPNFITFKAIGTAQYISGENKISDFEYIRECVSRNINPVPMDVIETDVIPDFSCHFDTKTLYPFEDPITNVMFKDLTIDSKPPDRITYTLPFYLVGDTPYEAPEKIFTRLIINLPSLGLDRSTTVHVESNITVKRFIDEIVCEQLRKTCPDPSMHTKINPAQLIVRVTGTHEYLVGLGIPLSDFRAIRMLGFSPYVNPNIFRDGPTSPVPSGSDIKKISLDVIELDSLVKTRTSIVGGPSSSGTGSTGTTDEPNEEGGKKFNYYRGRARVRAETAAPASSNEQQPDVGPSQIAAWDLTHIPLSCCVRSLTYYKNQNGVTITSNYNSPAIRRPDVSSVGSNAADPSNVPGSPTAAGASQQILEECIYVKACVYYGDQLISTSSTEKTSLALYDVSQGVAMWPEDIFVFPELPIADVPDSARVCFSVYSCFRVVGGTDTSRTKTKQIPDQPIGWVNVHLFNHKGELMSGTIVRKLWRGEAQVQNTTCTDNIDDKVGFQLEIMFPKFMIPVVCTNGKNIKYKTRVPYKLLDTICSQDSLYELTEGDKFVIWSYRDTLRQRPNALSKVLQSVEWTNPTAVCEAYRLLKDFTPLDPLYALELLDVRYQDVRIREYAVSRLELLSDQEIADYMLQLIECLKHEPYHASPLSLFLLRRAVKAPLLVGHTFFWCLKAEMNNQYCRERFGLLLQEYLRTSTTHAEELRKQVLVVDALWDIALKIKQITNKKERTPALQKMINEMLNHIPSEFNLPVSPKFECSGIVIDRCKVMSSAKMPLRIVFQNADPSGEDIPIIFKAGDDLKQDTLTLQILRIMEQMWKRHGLDLKLIPYGCVSTDDGVGMIEVVKNAETIADITAGKGAISGALSAMSKEDDSLLKWLTSHNKTEAEMAQAINTFVHSCAGYFVATYVLGIGDRHSDNIMITKSGNLFHIDFGHFLGHFKMIGNIERETSPFVFTPMYSKVLGGVDSEHYRKLETLAGEAYNVLRKNGNVLLSLFKLMRFTGIPELESVKDIEFLRNRLALHLSDEEANAEFSNLMLDALTNMRQLLSDAVHVIKHKL